MLKKQLFLKIQNFKSRLRFNVFNNLQIIVKNFFLKILIIFHMNNIQNGFQLFQMT